MNHDHSFCPLIKCLWVFAKIKVTSEMALWGFYKYTRPTGMDWLETLETECSVCLWSVVQTEQQLLNGLPETLQSNSRSPQNIADWSYWSSDLSSDASSRLAFVATTFGWLAVDNLVKIAYLYSCGNLLFFGAGTEAFWSTVCVNVRKTNIFKDLLKGMWHTCQSAFKD